MSAQETSVIVLPAGAETNAQDAGGRQEKELSYAKVSVVIPTLNEAANLPEVLPWLPQGIHEVIIVDGHSDDGTTDVARLLFPGARILLEKKRGKGAALRRGLREATGDIIVTLDADGSMDPAEIPAFVGALLAGADYAKGSRFLQGGGTADMGTFRYLGNWVFRILVRALYGGKYSDLCYGYNAFRRDALKKIDLAADGFEIEALINVSALSAGLLIAEVPSHEAERVHGQSHLRSFPDGWRILKTILLSRLKHSRSPRSALSNRHRRQDGHRFEQPTSLQLLTNDHTPAQRSMNGANSPHAKP